MSLRDDRQWGILLAAFILFLATFSWFLVDGGLIEPGGDAFGRWANLVNLASSGQSLDLDHHGLRWGLNLPILFFLKHVSAPHPVLYHVFMPAFGAGTAVAIYLVVRTTARSIRSEIAFFCMVLSLMILPLGERPFSQLLPMGAATFYMCLTTYFLKGAFERESRGASGWLFLAGIAALLAYAAKLTMIFFGLPLSITLLVVLLRDRQIFRAVAFFSPLIVGFIIEVWMVHQGTGSLLGRALYVISELNSHGRGLNYLGTLDAAADLGGWGFGGFWEYFLLSPAKYFEALGLYSLVIYASVLLALYELVYRRRNQQDRKLDFCLAGTIVGFFLLQSYVVVSFEPYIFPEKYIHERYQYALFILCGIFLIRRVCENKWLRESGKGLGGSNRLFVIAVLVLVFSSLFLSNNIFSRHNNFGFVVTIVHERFLSKWEDDGGALGYLANAPGDGSLSGARSALLNTAHAAVIPRYVKAIYLFDYCELEDSYVYVDSDRVYGLCSPWKMNETVLIYQIYNVSLIRPNNLRFLGKFSGDNGS